MKTVYIYSLVATIACLAHNPNIYSSYKIIFNNSGKTLYGQIQEENGTTTQTKLHPHSFSFIILASKGIKSFTIKYDSSQNNLSLAALSNQTFKVSKFPQLQTCDTYIFNSNNTLTMSQSQHSLQQVLDTIAQQYSAKEPLTSFSPAILTQKSPTGVHTQKVSFKKAQTTA